MNIEVISRPTGILSDHALGIGLFDCLLKLNLLVPELASPVNVGSLCSHTETNNEGSFDKLMRVMSQDLSVFASARLRLVRVDNQVGWSGKERTEIKNWAI